MRQGYKSVIVKNFERLLSGQAPVINGDGRQVLDYIFVDDVVELTLRAMMLPLNGALCNVCSGKGIDVRSLTRLMQQVAGTDHHPVFAAPDITHQSSRVGDPTRMYALLGNPHAIPLETGLYRTLQWIQSQVRPT